MTVYQITAEGPGTLKLNQKVKVRGSRKAGTPVGRVIWVSEDGKSANVDVDDRPRWARRKAMHKGHNLATRLADGTVDPRAK